MKVPSRKSLVASRVKKRRPPRKNNAVGRRSSAGLDVVATLDVVRRIPGELYGLLRKVMKLIVGLGNPGRKYEATRHNVGFDVVAELARRQSTAAAGRGGSVGFKSAFQGEAADGLIGTEKVLLLRPQTFMNRSGQSVVAARDFYKLTNEDLLVVCDDLNLPSGKLRLREKGSSGGQKGLEDIIRAVGGDAFSRLRVGIGQPPGRMDAADYVLAKFTPDEKTEMAIAVQFAADAAEVWVREGASACMNRYNQGTA